MSLLSIFGKRRKKDGYYYQYKSADGRKFVSKEYADAHKNTTIRIKRPATNKKPKV